MIDSHSSVSVDKKLPSFVEFVALMASLIALTALSIDTLLPALGVIATDMGVENANHVQLIIGMLFFGFTFGQLLYGPLSDTIGRKMTIHIGFTLFIGGSVLCLFAQSLPLLLAGRFIQGVGVAAPRIVSVAITRDLFSGRDMARVMSIVMAVFIFVPAIAPALGQVIMVWDGWRTIFTILLGLALLVMGWMQWRLPETLASENRRPFKLRIIMGGVREVLTNKVTLHYTLCAGLMFGLLVSYLTSAQQIFQDLYGVGDRFALYFAYSAISIGVGSIVNSMLVKKLGMRMLAHTSIGVIMFLSAIMLALVLLVPDSISVAGFMWFLVPVFFFVGICFGNLNAIAMEPMGHMAGIASAIIGAGSSAISVLFGSIIGQLYDHTLLPFIAGIFGLSLVSFIIQFPLRKH